MTNKYANILSIERHRINIDGDGVRTLVCFGGCHLSCKYCLNHFCHNPKLHVSYSIERLLQEVSIDDIYFRATDGGVTFGGGEPLMYSDFVSEFCAACPTEWDFAIETSLNVSSDKVQNVLPYIASWIIDIKDINPKIYRKYTRYDNTQVVENLKLLSNHSIQNKCTIRIPNIPEYNSESDIEKSVSFLQSLGFENQDIFNYVTIENTSKTYR